MSVDLNIADSYTDTEVVGFQLKFDRTALNFLNVYRAPGTDNICKANMSKLIDCLQKFCSADITNIIVGDFNLPSIDWASLAAPDDGDHLPFLDFINRQGFVQFNNEPTRGDHILDLVFSDDPQIIAEIHTENGFSTSDHDSVLFNVIVSDDNTVGRSATAVGNSDGNTDVFVHDFRKADYDGLRSYLACVDWYSLYCFSAPEYLWSNFTSILKAAFDIFVPIRRVTTRLNVKRYRYPKYIRNELNKKHRAWVRYKKLNTTESKQHYNEVARKCKVVIYEFESLKEKKIIESKNLGQFYRHVNSRLSCKSGVAPLRRTDGTYIADNQEKANILNEFFGSVFTKDNGIDPHFSSRVEGNDKLDDIAFTPANVRAAIKKLKSTAAAGPDCIPPVVFIELSSVLCVPLADIFSQLLNSGVVPDEWKTALVTPVFKGGASSDPNNYRPISLTSVASKLMESVIRTQMLKYLFDHNLITKHQHGFLSRHSTCTQLLECLNDWSLALKNKSSVDVLYVDYAKAFDSISHTKLLIKLNGYGIGGKVHKFISSFLADRKQQVTVGGKISRLISVTSGVPQGSILGPILFLLYINDVADLFDNVFRVKLFADDLKLYTEVNIASDAVCLQEHLSSLADWSEIWQLNISTSKCSVLHVSTCAKTATAVYNVNDCTITVSNAVRDLGVFVDMKLNFRTHVAKIVSKAHQRCNILLRCFTHTSVSLLLKAFLIYVRPILEYASVVWSPSCFSLITELEKVQRRFTKRLSGLSKMSYLDRLQTLSLPTLEVRRLTADLIFCYKIINGLVSLDPADFFVFHESKTRGHKHKLVVQHSRVDARQHFFCNRVVPVWNSLPEYVVLSPTVGLFRINLHRVNLEKFLLVKC